VFVGQSVAVVSGMAHRSAVSGTIARPVMLRSIVMRALVDTIRDHINQPRISHLLRKSVEGWNLLTSSLDVIEDAELAIAAYGHIETSPADDAGNSYQLRAGARYLTTYGLLQAFFIQQDAVFHLCKALGTQHELKSYPKLEAIREIRNISIGHPTKVDRPKSVPISHHFISRISMSSLGFQLLSFYDDGTSSSRNVEIGPLIADQHMELSKILTEVIEELVRREAAHTAEFQAERLTDAFPQALGYCFEKIGTALRGSGPMELGQWGIESVAKAVSDFREALNRRGLEVGAMPFVDLVFDELAYPVEQLQRYLRQEPNDLPNVETARIFTSYVFSTIHALKGMAQEIDGSYSAASQPTLSQG
jgi:hypothetical protein